MGKLGDTSRTFFFVLTLKHAFSNAVLIVFTDMESHMLGNSRAKSCLKSCKIS